MEQQLVKQKKVLEKELDNIKNGQDILNIRKKSVEMDISNIEDGLKSMEDIRAVVLMLNSQPKMQGVVEQLETPSKLLDIQELDNLEDSGEQKNIEREQEKEVVL